MSRGREEKKDLHGASSEGGIDQDSIEDDGNGAIEERMTKLLPVKISIARVVGVNCDGRIAQHRFGTSRSNNDLTAAFNRVGERPEAAKGKLALSTRDLAIKLWDDGDEEKLTLSIAGPVNSSSSHSKSLIAVRSAQDQLTSRSAR
jgi:hypothetical protein